MAGCPEAERFPTRLCCDVAKVSCQAFFDWRARHAAGPTPREAADAALAAEIREIHTASGGTYGSPRVTAELRARGHRVNPKRVARFMRTHRIAGIRPRRPKRTTTPARSAPKLPDLVGRRFAPGAPDRARVSGITYVRTGEGWLYLAVVLDLGSRRLLGYQMSDRINTRLVADALDMAGAARQHRTPGTVFHSDRGSQSAVSAPRRTNAVAEALFSSLKRELVHRHRYPDRATARRSILEWLARYNTHRHRTSLDCRTRSPRPSHRGNHTRLNHLTGQRGEAPCT